MIDISTTRTGRVKAFTEWVSFIKKNSDDLYKLLTERKKKKEGVREYSIATKKLASRVTIEEGALFDYIIRGIKNNDIWEDVVWNDCTQWI